MHTIVQILDGDGKTGDMIRRMNVGHTHSTHRHTRWTIDTTQHVHATSVLAFLHSPYKPRGDDEKQDGCDVDGIELVVAFDIHVYVELTVDLFRSRLGA